MTGFFLVLSHQYQYQSQFNGILVYNTLLSAPYTDSFVMMYTEPFCIYFTSLNSWHMYKNSLYKFPIRYARHFFSEPPSNSSGSLHSCLIFITKWLVHSLKIYARKIFLILSVLSISALQLLFSFITFFTLYSLPLVKQFFVKLRDTFLTEAFRVRTKR